ncbi:phospholipase A2 inhibitor gamma subunit B-like [Heteronotia binoei]|uniref:phospholipase A2 inhibitor gamma subunit B-like n=1 Tax=Heteronotia binoei TaxID=13085 RepID=UPI00292EC466|nr:phospholipase A2 inhibitor gamma subunit B-like [Heteronotia binoei]
MWTLLGCCLFAVLLATGTCLKCEVCNSIGTTCKGPMMTCGAGEDTCMILRTVIVQPPVTTQTVSKDCANSSVCNVNIPDPEINMGKGMRMRVSRTCCTGDSCQTASPSELPPSDDTPNKLHCPGCFGVYSSECYEQRVACTGSQNKCIEIAGNTTSYLVSVDFTSKGCANEGVCDHLKTGFLVFGGMRTWVTKANCTAASATAAP